MSGSYAFVRGHPVPPRAGAACGIIAVSVFVVLYATAVSRDPGYTFLEDYLSDLGVGPGAWAFNSALILSGAFVAAFAVAGVAPPLGRSTSARAGATLLAIAGILLMNVGVFTEDYGDVHFAFSVSFFLVLLAALGILSHVMYRTRVLGMAGAASSAVSFAFGLLLLATGLNPMAETLAVLTALAWGVLSSVLLLLRAAGRPIP